MRTKDDPTITRIRDARRRVSERCGHDPQEVVDYYIELQRQYQHRLVIDASQKAVRSKPGKPSAANTIPALSGVATQSQQTHTSA